MQTKKIFKVALTGGPCAGKTTSLTRLREFLSTEFMVYSLPEVASMTFSTGVTIIPSEFTEENHFHFTQGICQMQIDLEKYFEKIASVQRKPVIILCDRGVCDNFAYCSPSVKARIMESTGWNQNFLCNERYDMVIHLMTAANGAEKFYTLENNNARSETPEQARELDYKIQKEYMGHPKYCIIDNSTSFQIKIDRVIQSVYGLLEKPGNIYVKKYLLDKNYSEEDISKDIKVEVFTEFKDILVHNKPDVIHWVVKRVYKDSLWPLFTYYTRKLVKSYEERIETQKLLSEKLYFDFLSQKNPHNQQLKRKVISFLYQVKDKMNIYHLEESTVNGKTFNILRVIRDVKHDEGNYIPEFIKVVKEITDDQEFFSLNMTKS